MRIHKCFLHVLACLSSLSLTDGAPISTGNIEAALKMWANNKDEAVRRFGPIEKWTLVGFQDLDDVFWDKSDFNADLTEWDVTAVTSAQWTFNLATNFNGDISQWNVGNLENADNMFLDATSFNRDVADWDVSSVTSMIAMFAGTTVFNQRLNAWDVSNVTDMDSIFWAARAFSMALSKWDVSNVENMNTAFFEATAFNKNVDWEMGKITTLETFFYKAETFNADISGWDTSSVTDLTSCFEEAYEFNSDINSWDVSRVVGIDYLFYYAAFNTPLDSWDTASLETAMGAFQIAESFNQDISGWNTLKLKNANLMFEDATSFNQDLSEWRVDKLMDAENMFYYALDFNQRICWDLPKKTSTTDMFRDTSAEISCCKDDKQFFLKEYKSMGKVTCGDIHDETLFSRKGDAKRWWDVCLEETAFKGKKSRVGGFCPEACETFCIPTDPPTASPTSTPTDSPTGAPTGAPTEAPTGAPTAGPTPPPTESPTTTPTESPTAPPTESPTGAPTETLPIFLRKKCEDDKKFKKSCNWVAKKPVKRCQIIDADSGEKYRTHCHTKCGCVERTSSPTETPTSSPTGTPTASPTETPTSGPTETPIESPTLTPTESPTAAPTKIPTAPPTKSPTGAPTGTLPIFMRKKCEDDKKFKKDCKWVAEKPVKRCHMIHSDSGEKYRTYCNTKCNCVEYKHTSSPTETPTSSPTETPTSGPTDTPTHVPTSNPTASPTPEPTSSPTASPTHVPTSSPTDSPSTTAPTAGPTVLPTSRPTNPPTTPEPTAGPTKEDSCQNSDFEVSAESLGYTGKISCEALDMFKNISVCRQKVTVNGRPRVIRNLCPGKCKQECLDTTIQEQVATEAPTVLSCENNGAFRKRGGAGAGWITCKLLHRVAHMDICAMKVNFKGEKTTIRDLCPGKCKSACCADVENIYLKLKNSKQRINCNRDRIERYCDEEVLTDAGATPTQVRDWCPHACGSTCVSMPDQKSRVDAGLVTSMPNTKSRVDSGLLRYSGAPSTSTVPTIM